ncbi:hypothetical protein H5410_037517 [Solanum commersonii]|uniref:Uncharacterized protein n=1 Tax=Solanum commersonii TaxID=4109 RepID=A0A9J5Y824_SOLCO|nr:hypothetical protein H5410_037517 [Solanum commersonii]
MVEVAIYFHHGGEWLTSPEPHYDRGCVTYWKGYDPNLISFIDLVNEYINKLGFVGVQELIVLAPTGKYFEIIADERVRTLTSFISTEYKSIHLFATEDCELSVDVIDIVMHNGSFLLSPIVNEGTDCSESEDDNNNGMVFSCSDYDTDELENFVTKKKRNITDGLQDYKEIVKGMAFKDIAEAKQFCKLYALAKKVELVVLKSDKKKIEAKQGKQLTKKQGKQPAKQGKESGRGEKRQLRRGLVDEDEVAEDDDEDPSLRPRTISEEAFLTRLKKKHNPQEPIGSRVIGFRGDKFGVSEPTNLPIGPTGLTWNGQGAVTTNQLQKLRPRRG